MRRRRGFTLRCLAVGSVVLAAACGGGDDRPSGQAWEPVWVRYRNLITPQETFVAGGEDRCDALVGELRTGRQDLLPTPDEALDDAVHAWLNEAQSVVFDCPEDAELAERLHTLGVLAAEVDAGFDAGTSTSTTG